MLFNATVNRYVVGSGPTRGANKIKSWPVFRLCDNREIRFLQAQQFATMPTPPTIAGLPGEALCPRLGRSQTLGPPRQPEDRRGRAGRSSGANVSGGVWGMSEFVEAPLQNVRP